MTQVNIITTTLPPTFGGRTKSLLQRAKLLNEAVIPVRLISINYRENYQAIYQKYRNEDRILSNTTFDNIYDYYKRKLLGDVKSWQTYLTDTIGNIDNYIKVNRSAQFGKDYYYREGIPKFVLNFKAANEIDYFATYVQEQFDARDFYYVHQTEGYVHRIDRRDAANQLIKQEFLAPNGEIYVTRLYDNKERIVKIILQNGNLKQEFLNEKNFFAQYFSEIFGADDVVINDARALDWSLLQQTQVKKRIYQLHNSHLINPVNNLSGTKGSFKTLFTWPNLTADDVIVSLTEKQKEDILSEHPNLDQNIVVIPHAIKSPKISHRVKKNHIAIIARLHPQKNLTDAIKAFAIFLKTYPKYKLDIYGDGEDRDKLEKLSSELSISESIIFHGQISLVDKAYQSSEFSLVTSTFEGFSLSTLESISNGTPVVTYEINYGPTDIIDDASGYIAETRTPEALAEKMLEAVKNPKKREQVKKRANIFSEHEFTKRWLEIIK